MENTRKADHSTSDSAASIESPEQQLLSLKTSSLQVYHLGLFSINGVLHQLLELYDTQFNELRFLNYKRRQRMQAKMVNIFVNGGRKYDKRKARKCKKYRKEQKGKKRKGKRKERKPGEWKAADFEQSQKIPLIAFGNGRWGPNVCHKCQESMLKPIHEDENKELHSILACNEVHCKTVWNRESLPGRNL
ncbi:uncharacterized protein BYT42DRAFT_544042 [Radiomyces spectabilis]|uniref:uncharacterized protein n=1 Tax=Radiomyces spectabilis TaxID=64574 RepID=UPI00221F1896|nr:uncharacterized protein BYT42DRAFT_544042 [Radiomyces spectabilis]KAI8388813.1 hypothetical protein BYT42DRAFT_544042 [Radiomyces spectabilis]